MSKIINVEIIENKKDGETLCFLLKDSNNNLYKITNCHIKETFGEFLGYHGMCNEHIAHLDIYPNRNSVLAIMD